MDRESWDEISRWPYIFWLGNVDIIRGRAVHAPWLSDLNDEKLVLEPKAYAQKGYVKLSDKQLEVFDSALDEAFSRFGTHHPEPGSIWWNDKINDQKYWVTRSLLESMAEEQGKLRKA